MSNRLSSSQSPYLLQHAKNPVDWFEWGEDAFTASREREKPILLSIGYSSCHWCHVMAHESFEDPAIASFMNDHFVNIKVDREERPDVDAFYMDAVQSITGQGGWPLNVFLTTDLKPFFGGTYWPSAPAHGMASWLQVLQSVSHAWRVDRQKLEDSGNELVSRMTTMAQARRQESVVSLNILEVAQRQLAQQFDPRFGGFGQAPKFPQPAVLEFLLRSWRRTGDPAPLAMVTLTLDQMAEGGIHDQLAGGFHRYSTDASWTIPHFEKMLYDNALLALLYVAGWQATGNPNYREVAISTLNYILNELHSDEGGFYASQDADTDGVEGGFYMWSADELQHLISVENLPIIKAWFGVTDTGNLEGLNILTRHRTVEEVAQKCRVSAALAERAIAESTLQMILARKRRTGPSIDWKILTDWNALAVRALTIAGWAFRRPEYTEAAIRVADALSSRLDQTEELSHVHRVGRQQIPGMLDDYAFFLQALETLFESTGALHWLDQATKVAGSLIDQFGGDDGGFYTTSRDRATRLPSRIQSWFDGPYPSGYSSAVMGLLRLSRLTGNPKWKTVAEIALSRIGDVLAHHPTAFAYHLCSLDEYFSDPLEIVISGRPSEKGTQELIEVVSKRYLPQAVFATLNPDEVQETELPLLQCASGGPAKPRAYVCRNYACNLPVSEATSLETVLSQWPRG